jgi:Fur family ferric uptake transcriptional regulator
VTEAPHIAPVVVSDAEAATRILRGAGLRLSTARRLVIEALFAAQGPVSANQLSDQLRIDESSVYRNLEVLERHGLVRHLHLGHGPGLYALAEEGEPEYLYCESCSKVTVVAPGQLDPARDAIRNRFGFTPRFSHFAVVGVCQRCTAESS